MKIRNLFSVMVIALSYYLPTFAADQLTLEHTFNGYYIPYNIPLYNMPADGETYFYSNFLRVDGNIFKYISYNNEDFSVRDNIYVTFDIPNGYKVSTISYSPGMKFPDGRGFFIVSFEKSEYTERGNPNYAIANAYDIETGKKIVSLGSASMMITALSYFYVINGKISLITYNLELEDNKTSKTSYTTCVYSLGEADNAVHSLPSDKSRPVPIISVDSSGRIIDQPISGSLSITRMSDGSTVKTLNK